MKIEKITINFNRFQQIVNYNIFVTEAASILIFDLDMFHRNKLSKKSKLSVKFSANSINDLIITK
jgi:hypothetical protein